MSISPANSAASNQSQPPGAAINRSFDYIIVGAGCAGLSLLARMIQAGNFTQKRILLVDRAPKTLNDRTWCFWAKPSGKKPGAGSPSAFFDPIVHHQWEKLWLKHPEGDIPLRMEPYVYKMIRGVDFYKYCFDMIRSAPYVHLQYGEVSDIDAGEGSIRVGGEQFFADIIFSSVLLDPPVLQPNQYYLLQHFRGWWIETNEDVFDPQQADLMNFRTSQEHGCTFVYVLPVSARRALVEYTLFTEDELTSEAYDEGLRQFIQQELKINSYKIDEVENGVIPMTNLHFPLQKGKVYFIGTAGGQTKASTGYTFQFIQKQANAILQSLISGGKPALVKPAGRFNFYDSVLLRVLHERKIQGADIFHRMFIKNKASLVMRFLDNETNLAEELRIMNSSRKSIFLPAALKEMG